MARVPEAAVYGRPFICKASFGFDECEAHGERDATHSFGWMLARREWELTFCFCLFFCRPGAPVIDSASTWTTDLGERYRVGKWMETRWNALIVCSRRRSTWSGFFVVLDPFPRSSLVGTVIIAGSRHEVATRRKNQLGDNGWAAEEEDDVLTIRHPSSLLLLLGKHIGNRIEGSSLSIGQTRLEQEIRIQRGNRHSDWISKTCSRWLTNHFHSLNSSIVFHVVIFP